MITMKDIIREGHKNLLKVAAPVKLPLSDKDKKTLNQMMEFILNSQDKEIAEKYQLRGAVGLAAPQINVLKRMLAVDFVDVDSVHYQLALINPLITSHSEELIYLPGGEGCLSVDRDTKLLLTPRYESIKIESFMLDIPTQNVYKVEINLSGYAAIVLQHEIDHLDGILYTSKMYESIDNAKPAFELEEDPQEPIT
ncbi:peptide deformylase [Acholeplasma sp. OttesenSCG-928-E16]|nr:peptide deformylase [Acholeplasma sp. OttesenSCG-928-E16]